LKSRSNLSPRLRLECLEDRVQPSVLAQPLSGALTSGPVQVPAPLPLTPLQAQLEVAQLLGQQGTGAPAPQSIDYATYVTGSPHTATGEGVAVDSSDSQYVVGSAVLDLADGGTATFGFIAKYLPHSTTLDPAFNGGAPVTFRLNFGSAGVYDIDLHAVTVDADPNQGNVDVVGSGTNTATGNQLAIFVTFDRTGTFVGGAGFGSTTGTDPNNLTGIAPDGMGDVVFTGTAFVSPGTAQLVFGFLPDGSTGVQAFVYDFSPDFTSSGGNGIAIDAGATFAYVTGTLTAPDSGSTKLGFAGQIPIDGQFGLSGFVFQDTDANGALIGDFVLSGTAVNNNTGESYFVGTAAASGGGTSGVVLRFTNDPVNGFTFDQNASLLLTDDPQNSISLTGVAVDQNTGNVYIVGSALNTDTGNLNVLVGQFDDLLTVDTSNNALVGASGTDTGAAVAVTSTGSIAVVGTTTSPDFSTDGSTLAGAQDAFLLQFTF
jgi:hypothetical protein